MNAEATHTPAARGEVAPFILEAVGDVARPRGVPRLNTELGHLVGASSLYSGITALVRYVREGVGWARELTTKYPPVFRLRFGLKQSVAVWDPELVLGILRNEDGVWSAAIAWRDMFDGIGGPGARMHGPLFTDFEAHRDVRRLLAPAFTPAAMTRYMEVASPLFETAIESWITSGVVDAKPEIRALLASVAGRIFVGFPDSKDQAVLDRWMQHIWGGVLALVKNPYLDPNWRRAQRAYGELMDRLEALVKQRRLEPSDDLLSRVAAASEATQDELDDDRARASVVLNIMLAAFDTTACGLTSLVYLLAKHPEWQERLRAEAQALGPHRLSFDQTRALMVTDRAWRESLRLFPIAGAPPRIALRDIDVGGVHIPAGTLVSAMTNTLGFDTRFWTEPDVFDPDRFAPGREEDKRHRAAYLPFGSGAHTCIGMQLANAEARAFVHTLLTRCRVRLETDYTGTHRNEPLGTVSGRVRIVLERLPTIASTAAPAP